MKKIFYLICLWSFSFAACTEDDVDNLLNQLLSPASLSEAEIVDGLKTALEVGAENSVQSLSAQDGFFKDEAVKILLPEEVSTLLEAANEAGLGSQLSIVVDPLVESLNRSAEDAVMEAGPIFVQAITDMTVSDGLGILTGEDDAATQYLEDKTYDSLQVKFSDKIKTSLSKPLLGESSFNSLWPAFVSKYNVVVDAYNLTTLLNPSKEPLERIEQSDLSMYVTGKALDGMFLKIADEEGKIRKDPLARVEEILQKVFGTLDEN
ncbi:DUF4197 domain-containing protein [Aureibacter tunicatorum]|uniref:DUF4197 domain-containing protein n=1 Tax=Aureibacter tunicatorum TaxID=866807 RepID=A0AAE4BRU4_9BACT|nr:DUF4197 domain-containing protein [Aureibacter tunicatorum]MDR6238210.1 hypothetical protein [Aureibacter tunicatorum]BDD03243.1 hypothetical protein AUTU_07260 [Aureibacter tunicatorum]